MKRLLPLLLLFGISAFGASRTSLLVVQFRPEAVLVAEGAESARLKIRLAQGATAQLWIAESCDKNPAEAYVISNSSEFAIPLSAVPGSGAAVCLASSDGAIRTSAPLSRPVVRYPGH